MTLADGFALAFLAFGVLNATSELFAMEAYDDDCPPSWHLIVFGLCPMYWVMRGLCRKMAP